MARYVPFCWFENVYNIITNQRTTTYAWPRTGNVEFYTSNKYARALLTKRQGPLLLTWINFNTSIDKRSQPNKLWDEIIYPYTNLNGASVVQWMRNSIPNYTMGVIIYPCWHSNKSILANGAPSQRQCTLLQMHRHDLSKNWGWFLYKDAVLTVCEIPLWK